MPADWLKDVKHDYDVIVIGSGLAGLTAANRLATCGYSVLLLEHHYNFGGMATWFKRRGNHIFDISLHGFPIGMVKTCRKYWSADIADSIVQIKGIRFDNPQFSFTTTFDRTDFTDKLVTYFKIPPATVEAFFQFARSMNFYDDQAMTTRDLFQKYFPGRHDLWRLLMEPIAYANGSTLDDPAITFGIVFSNFMNKGVYTFQGGTDKLIMKMKATLKAHGVDLRHHALVEKVLIEKERVAGVVCNGRTIRAKAVLSNANLTATIHSLVGDEYFGSDFIREARAVRLNSSSCQVYMGIRKGETIPNIGDLFFTSSHPVFDSEALNAMDVTSRTYSLYYPDTRPGSDRYAIVCSTNANYRDWAALNEDAYRREKERLIEGVVATLEKYLPGVHGKIDHLEASTPRTFEHYTRHVNGASFGTKFEGLKVSQNLPKQISGLFHAGSVGIIMSGWLGAINYGVIVANEMDKHLRQATGCMVQSPAMATHE
ncbi:MAG: NAD(P)/FAD-dependent oxidoreductase [Nitrospirae bacterium]|nr:MAG: NAD(P)/FAD-dependent oxidoreductase [Nitrospirota bacterium]